MGALFGLVGDGTLEEVRAMGARLTHRGSFQQTWNPAPGVYFGQAGWKPLESTDCALYAADWGAQLPGELLLAEALSRGMRSFSDLRGFFSIAICIGTDVLIAVDQVGYKELYYTSLPGRLAFASEYKALLALSDLPAHPNRDAVQQYLATKQPLARRSFLEGIYRIPAGHAIRVSRGRHAMEPYWQPREQLVVRSTEAHVAAVRQALLCTVERQIAGCPEVGITIGGGLDAAAVLAAVRRVAPDLAISTFTIGTGPNDPEILGAREAARAFGTRHHESLFKVAAIPSQLPRLVWLTEDCAGREEALLQLQVLSEAGSRVRCLMGGHGADVIFGGMPRHRLVALAEQLPWLHGPLGELFALSQAGVKPASLAGRAAGLAVYGRYPPEALRVPGGCSRPQWYWQPRLNDFIRATCQQINSLHYLEPAHEAARATFSSPFLDPDMIALSLTIPGRLKTGWRRHKWVLREALRDLLPVAIRRRRKAIQRIHSQCVLGETLTSCAELWFRESALERHQLVSQADLRRLLLAPVGALRSRERISQLWTLLSVECWARTFLDLRGRLPSLPTAADSSDVYALQTTVPGARGDGSYSKGRIPDPCA
jgi:asparagine synthase (glutamine-hydrolysing)